MIPLAVLALVLLSGTSVLAQSGANVAVVINESSAASVRIGEYYAQKRQVPAENIVRIKTSVDETINRTEFADGIATPIAKALTAHALQDRILYIVLTKGVPLRIAGTSGRNGTGASVDSELTLLYRRMTGRPVPPGGAIQNPYYLRDADIASAKPFTRKAHDIFLVTRLDAFTVDEAIALVDRAVAPSAEGAIVLDGRGDSASAIGDRWITETARTVAAQQPDRALVADQSAAPVTGRDQVLGYFSWGSGDPALRQRRLGLGFAAGAVATTLASTDARTFTAPPENWKPDEPTSRAAMFAGSSQSLIADLIREGVTGIAGNIAEPYLESAVRPQILIPAYLRGFNLAEAFYLALPSLGWQTIVIGDPLCRPFTKATVTPDDVDEPMEPTSGLPALFVRRSVETMRQEMPAAPREALLQLAAAQAHLTTGDRAAAKTALAKVISLMPDNVDVRLQLATLHDEDSEWKEALEGYRRIIELRPRNVGALNNLAYLLVTRTKDLDEALAIARRAADIAPKDPSVLDTLGWIEHLKGSHQDAAVHLRAAAQGAPDKPEIRLHAAMALAKAGAAAEALRHLEAAVQLDPTLEKRDDVLALQRMLKGG